MKKIALICASELPLPAVKGGGAETLMMHLINENEVHKAVEFCVYSFFDEKASALSKKYKCTLFHYYERNKWKHVIDYLYRLLRRLSLRKMAFKSNFLIYTCKEILKDKPDVVLIAGNQMYVDYIKRNVDVPIILHMHTDLLNVDTPNAKRIVNNCRNIFVISNYCKKRVCEIDPEFEKKIVVFRNTIDFSLFDRSKSLNHLEIKRKYGINNSFKTIIFCGRLDEGKGALQLVQALEMIDEKVSYNLLVVGGALYSSNKETEYIINLKQICKKLKNKVVFTGHIDNILLPDLYSVSDLTIFPSQCNEAAGLITIESLAMGTPVFTTDRGGIPEYAMPDACEIIPVDEKFVEKLSNQILRFFEDSEYRENLTKSARCSELTYKKPEYYKKFIRIIDDIL